MPELIDDFGDPDRGPRADWFARIAHWLPVALVLDLAYSALQWVEVVRTEEWPWYLRWVTSLPFTVVIFTALFHQKFARICLKCMQDVPADAPVRAQAPRKKASLWFFHWNEKLYGLLPLVIIVGYSFAFAFILNRLGAAPGEFSWLVAPLDLFVLAFIWSIWVHHRYRPWCPYCKPWDDDGGVREPSPDPTGTGTKVSS
jgi:hypothetical protein